MPHPSRRGSSFLLGTLLLGALRASATAQVLPNGFVPDPIGSGWVNPVGLCYIDEQRDRKSVV